MLQKILVFFYLIIIDVWCLKTKICKFWNKQQKSFKSMIIQLFRKTTILATLSPSPNNVEKTGKMLENDSFCAIYDNRKTAPHQKREYESQTYFCQVSKLPDSSQYRYWGYPSWTKMSTGMLSLWFRTNSGREKEDSINSRKSYLPSAIAQTLQKYIIFYVFHLAI